jgi:hypothetical protein
MPQDKPTRPDAGEVAVMFQCLKRSGRPIGDAP